MTAWGRSSLRRRAAGRGDRHLRRTEGRSARDARPGLVASLVSVTSRTCRSCKLALSADLWSLPACRPQGSGSARSGRPAPASSRRHCGSRAGPGRVTVEDIAAAADVSPRTFFNYFATKEDAVIAVDPEWTEQVVAVLTSRPADEEPLFSLREVFREIAHALVAARDVHVMRRQVLAQNPSLLPGTSLPSSSSSASSSRPSPSGLPPGPPPTPTRPRGGRRCRGHARHRRRMGRR